jgi:hypothetical protein
MNNIKIIFNIFYFEGVAKGAEGKGAVGTVLIKIGP